MAAEQINPYIGLVSELAREFNLSRPTVIKYLSKHIDKEICMAVRTCATKKIQQRSSKQGGVGARELERCAENQAGVPIRYLRGSRKLGEFTSFTSPRIHEQWRRDGLEYCVDGAGNFIYRTDNVVRFIETKYKPTARITL